MKKLLKIFTVIGLLVTTIYLTPSAIAFASEVNTPVENITIDSSSGLPSFDSWEDANKYVDDMTANFKKDTAFLNAPRITPMASNGTAVVDSYNYNVARITLYLSYGTSGNSNTGYITYANPYTSHTGLTTGMSWSQNYAHAQISSNGKDVYVTASGELVYSFLVNGTIEYARRTVNLSGYAYIIR